MNLRMMMLVTFTASLAVVSCSNNSTSEPQVASGQKEQTVQATSNVTMPPGTAISVTLVDSIDTDVQKTGAEFTARLSQSIMVDGKTLFARGAGAKGVLNKVVESGHLKTPAELSFSLTALEDTGGRWVNVGTTMIVEKKDSHTKREVAMIGGGAIVGGIVGKVIDQKGSTGIGVAAGAAAGTGLAAATGKQDIVHGAGSAVVFTSNQSINVAIR